MPQNSEYWYPIVATATRVQGGHVGSGLRDIMLELKIFEYGELNATKSRSQSCSCTVLFCLTQSWRQYVLCDSIVCSSTRKWQGIIPAQPLRSDKWAVKGRGFLPGPQRHLPAPAPRQRLIRPCGLHLQRLRRLGLWKPGALNARPQRPRHVRPTLAGGLQSEASQSGQGVVIYLKQIKVTSTGIQP